MRPYERSMVVTSLNWQCQPAGTSVGKEPASCHRICPRNTTAAKGSRMRLALLSIPCLLVVALFFAGALGCGQTGAQGVPVGKEIVLPAAVTTGGMGLSESVAKRRSVREFTSQALSMEQLSQLTWAGQGITDPEQGRRAAPSAGATYPLELYLLTKEGVFRYVPQGHKLVQLGDRDRRDDLSNAALGQASVAQAALDIVIVGVLSRTETKYGERAEQYVHIEAGAAGENILLQATALGLGAVPVGAFRDEAVGGTLALPQGETPLLIIPVGYPAP